MKKHVGPKAKGGATVSGRQGYSPNPNVSKADPKPMGGKHSQRKGHK
jgi:hypothetical protein